MYLKTYMSVLSSFPQSVEKGVEKYSLPVEKIL
jgi:hypothetical protein